MYESSDDSKPTNLLIDYQRYNQLYFLSGRK